MSTLVVWNGMAFYRLEYSDQQIDLILSFIQNHNPSQIVSPASCSPSSALSATNGPLALRINVNVGKSQSFNILLSGPPGTGTILTAEAAADRTDRPLFYLQAKGLGIKAASLDTTISRVFETADGMKRCRPAARG
ncbi:hypothetical protein HDV57DRAFT_486293 [Trichoderma longibrachiatum]|uniref:ATPase AAA-type core domain-containing protein n=1 Tax=Trichoderma longibrachiatum ATCC 18648 TaxID=983965 RepID=A0A2T4CBL6_TRILO|nr:hypothetical protein M440DRAFT_1398203 [Trichoderma longibrachiatum ATCC 18648]